MKNKIIAELKTAYAKLGLSDEAFDGVASLLEKTVTEESQIATAVRGDNVSALLKTIQGNIDSWKNKFYDTQKNLDDYKKLHPETKVEPPKKEDEPEPEWARKLREQNEQILAAQSAREAAEKNAATVASIKDKLIKDGCDNQGILELTLKGFALGEKETEDDAVKRMKTDYQTNAKSVFGDGPIPHVGSGRKSGDDDQATIDRRKAWVKQHLGEDGEQK